MLAISIAAIGLSCRAQLPPKVAPQSASPVELSTLSPNLVVPTDPSKPLRVAGGIVAGNIIIKTIPVFPPKTNCLHGSRVVQMHVVIGKDGRVKSAEAISGVEAMRQPNVDSLRQWVFRPFQFHGQPVEVDTTITNIVDLNNDGCSTAS
jgi:protein TonB